MSLLSSFFSRAFRFALVTGAAGCAAGLCPGLFGQTAVPSALDGFVPNVGGVVNAIVLEPDPHTAGQTDLLVGGNFSQIQPKGTTTPFTCWGLARLKPDGTPDTTFTPNFQNGVTITTTASNGTVTTTTELGVTGVTLGPTVHEINGQVFAVLVLPDGSLLVGGSFTQVTGVQISNLAHLNSDGTVDANFTLGTAANPASGSYSAEVQALALQPDGSILVGGAFGKIGTATCNRLGRIIQTGTGTGATFKLDTQFNPSPNAAVIAIAVQSDGNILIGGGFTNVDGVARGHIARVFHSDGSLDATFDPKTDLSVSVITVQPNGQILVGGSFTSFQPDGASAPIVCPNFARLNTDGTLDSTFQVVDPAGAVNAIALQPDGRILIGGNFIQIEPVSTGTAQTAQFLARINPDGTPDNDFAANIGINGVIDAIVVQADGEIVVGGNFNVISGAGASVPCDNIARFDSNGLPDVTFDPSKNGFILAVAAQPSSGDLIIGGSFTSIGGEASRFLARITPAGVIDPSFNPEVNGAVAAIVVEPDSTILIAGYFESVQGVERKGVARLNADGTLDTQFNPNPGTIGSVTAMAVQSNGQILLGGSFTTLQPDNATVSTPRANIARVNADGTLDTSFDPEASAAVSCITLQPNGQILLGGSFDAFKPGGATNTNANIITIGTAARLNSNGTVDQSFNPGPGGIVNTIAVQSDGNILIGGNFLAMFPQSNSGTPVAANYLARVTPNGTIDPHFLASTLNADVNKITIASNGQFYVSGFFGASSSNGSVYGASPGNYFVRFNKDGSTDSFGLSLNGPVEGFLLQPDGTLYLGGDFTIVDNALASQIVHINADGTLDTSFGLSSVGTTGSTVRTMALGPNGALVAGGDFVSGIGGGVSSNLVRINLSGAPDAGFTPNANGPVNALATLNTGTPIATVLDGLIWLTSAGTLRPVTFDPPPGFQITGTVQVIVLDPNQQYVYVGGTFTNSAAAPVGENLIRFFYNTGKLDTSFTPNPQGSVQAIVIQPNGQILIGGGFITIQPIGAATATTRQYLARLNSDGSIDPNFNPTANGAVDEIALEPNGQILVGGSFTTLQPNGVTMSTTETFLARLNTDGSLDTTFNPDPSAVVTSIVVQPNGQILIGGQFTGVQPLGTSTSIVRNNIARINSNGSVDLTFDPEANGPVNAILLQPDGRILLGGGFTTLSPGAATENVNAPVTTFDESFIARLNTDGSVDTTFNPNPNNTVNSIAFAPDGQSIYIGGFFNAFQAPTALTPTPRNFLAQVGLYGAQAGVVVGNFDPQLNSGVVDVVVAPDGSLILGGFFTTVDPRGILLVGGQFASTDGSPSIGEVAVNYLALLRNDGTAVASFAPNPNGPVDALAVQTNGQILAGGAFTSLRPNLADPAIPAKYIARIDGDGSMDSAFSANASAGGEVDAIALQGNGQIVIGGQFAQVDGQSVNYLARLNADGTLDTSFVPNVNGAIDAIAIQANGQILIAGAFTSVGGLNQSYLARLNATGNVDGSFTPSITGSGAVGVNSILVEANGGTGSAGPLTPTFTLAQGSVGVTPGAAQTLGIFIGGTFANVDGTACSNLAELAGDGTLNPTFNPGADNTVDALLLQSDGRLFAGGAFGNLGGQPRFRLGRLEANAPASEALGVSTDLTSIVFTNDGGPELSEVDFQVSTDDSTWTDLGFGSRSGGSSDWILTGLSLPANVLFYVRTFGVAPTSQNSSSGLTLFAASFAAISPILTSPVVSSATTINAVVNQPFFYAIATTNTPTNFSSNAPLPAGLILDPVTGIISGTPTATGTFTVGVNATNAAGTGSTTTLVFTVGTASTAAPVPPAARLTSVSARANVTSANPLIAGLYIGGNVPKTVLLRGAGPSLIKYGVDNALSNPVLHLYNSSGQQILTSGRWGGNGGALAQTAQTALAQIFDDLGAFPFALDSADAAVVTTLAPGGYTLQVADGAGTGGVALAEVYDADDNPLSLPQRIVALSGRAVVGPNNILIGGFYIQGAGMKTVLVRGAGPALSAFGVTNSLAKPYLQVFSGANVIAANQGWSTPLTVNANYPAATALAVAAAEASAYTYPFNTATADTAVVLTLPAGGYTAQISSADGVSSGTALFEVYELPSP
jgi:uncharacterized delta-60 repeat protein